MTGDAWDALMRLQDAVRAIPTRPALPARPESARLVEQLGAITAAEPPDERYLEALQRRISTAWLAGRGDTIMPRDMRAAPWVLWIQPAPAIRLPGLLEALGALAARNRRCLFNLIEAWIQHFTPDGDSIPQAGLLIRRLVRASSELRMASWQRADDRFELFDPTRGPKRLAAALGGTSGDAATALEAAGLYHPLRATSGYLRAAQRELLAGATAALRAPQRGDERVEAICAFVAPAGKLRFGDTAGEVARSLLSPWLDGGREPPTELRDRVRDFLIAVIGDPRLSSPGWNAAGEEASKLMRRWLARVSLKVFFELLSTHTNPDALRRWGYVKKFWSAYLDNGIDDSWVILGESAYHKAKSLSKSDSDRINLKFGRLLSGKANEAVLMMKMGNMICVEFSDFGKLRAWMINDPDCPKFGKSEYRKDNFARACLMFPVNNRYKSSGSNDAFGLRHDGPERSNWQGSAAMLIARHRGVTISDKDWMP